MKNNPEEFKRLQTQYADMDTLKEDISYEEENIDIYYYAFQNLGKLNLFLETIIYLLSLMSFNLSYNQSLIDSRVNLSFMICISVLKLISLALFVSIYVCKYIFDSRFGKNRQMEIKSFIFQFRFYFQCCLLLVHPLWFLRGVQSNIPERFWDNIDGNYEYHFFYRPVNHYLFLIQLFFFFFFILQMIYVTSSYNNLVYKKFCLNVNVNHDFFFVYRCILQNNGI